jgi:hypothetical protein
MTILRYTDTIHCKSIFRYFQLFLLQSPLHGPLSLPRLSSASSSPLPRIPPLSRVRCCPISLQSRCIVAKTRSLLTRRSPVLPPLSSKSEERGETLLRKEMPHLHRMRLQEGGNTRRTSRRTLKLSDRSKREGTEPGAERKASVWSIVSTNAAKTTQEVRCRGGSDECKLLRF